MRSKSRGRKLTVIQRNATNNGHAGVETALGWTGGIAWSPMVGRSSGRREGCTASPLLSLFYLFSSLTPFLFSLARSYSRALTAV